ncbi:hypothetical protein EYF80_003010 [Liparis tanakae]|uniref:Uncharacterized protein n=1 Tax=Liparis tanakae TaxID=230148 RepID=A0A4Z2J9V6_9TELE|nr:hypothetical protein EYF80_003010 [Liparis tanakae]
MAQLPRDHKGNDIEYLISETSGWAYFTAAYSSSNGQLAGRRCGVSSIADDVQTAKTRVVSRDRVPRPCPETVSRARWQSWPAHTRRQSRRFTCRPPDDRTSYTSRK